jgi:hypothetical protein
VNQVTLMDTGLQLAWGVCDVTLGAKIVNGRSLAARSIRTSEINVKQAYLELLRLRRLVREAKKNRFLRMSMGSRRGGRTAP